MNDYVIAKYIRLSQDEAISESLSIPNQRLLLDSHIEDLDLPGARILEFVDNGFTGTNVERPGFQEMIELVRCGRINCIVVKDFSRFARNALESGYYIEKVFPLYRVRFVAVGDRFDSSDYKDGTGGIDVAFKFMMNEYYSNDLSKKVKSAKHTLMKNGEYIVGGAIYGYRKSESCKWEPDPAAAEVVREIFAMALEGKTTGQIRDKLFAHRILAPREYEYVNKGKEITPKFMWPTQSVWRILTNEQYTGTYIAGKQETAVVGSRAQIKKDRSEWIVIPDSHPPIVSKEDFKRVQEILFSANEVRSANDGGRSKQSRKLFDKMEDGSGKYNANLYGYRMNESKSWDIDDSAADVVREIFEMVLRGHTTREIAEKLQGEKRIPPREYFKLSKGQDVALTYRWSLAGIRGILSNEQYTGAFVTGKTFTDKSGHRHNTPQNEWVIVPEMHPAIISKEVFGQAQVAIAQRKRKPKPHDYLLRGKIVCGTCGRAMIYGNSTLQPMYRCMNTYADPTVACHKLKLSTADVESAVIASIKKQAEVVLNTDDLSGFRKAAESKTRFDGFEVQVNNADMEKQINRLAQQRQQCYERFVSLEIDRDTFHSMKDDFTKQIDRLEKQLAASQRTARKRDKDRKIADLASNALSETAEPKDIVDALVEKVLIFSGNHIEIHWKFENFAEAI